MKIMDYYIRLRLHAQDQQHIRNSLQELADVLYCSTKNVKILLKKMSEEQLINWTPGRGRGNKTEILFTHNFVEAIDSYTDELLAQEKLKDIFLLLKEPLPLALQKKIESKLHHHFGYEPSNDMYDILKIPISRKIFPLDPAFVAVTTESHLTSQIFDTLVVYNDVTEKVEPHIAHTWELSEDGLTWTFYLRKDIYFHNETVLTSKDVRFSFERLKEVHSPFEWLTAEIVQIETPSPLQIRFHLAKPNLFFLHYVSSIQLAILPRDVSIENHHYIGTGPFKLAHYSEDNIVLEAFTHYFKERALLDRIEFWGIPDHVQIDADYELPNEEENERHNIQIEEIGCIYAGFNFTKPGPHHDMYFRKAWRELYDVETIHIYFFAFKDSANDAYFLKERCESLGIQVELHPFLVSDYMNRSIDQHADIIFMGEVFAADHELAFLNVFKNKSCFINRFMDPHYEKQINCLLDTFLLEENKEKRYELMYEIEEFLQAENIILFNYHVLKRKTYPSSLKNVTIDSFGWANFAKLWIQPSMS